MSLTERDRQILDFEAMHWHIAGSKKAAIRERFELSTTRYYQLLAELLDSPEAMEHAPLVVRRLRRQREQRRRVRFEGTSATQPPGR